jgi:hypothetical protein
MVVGYWPDSADFVPRNMSSVIWGTPVAMQTSALWRDPNRQVL